MLVVLCVLKRSNQEVKRDLASMLPCGKKAIFMKFQEKWNLLNFPPLWSKYISEIELNQ